MQMYHLNATFYPGHHHGFLATDALGIWNIDIQSKIGD